MGRGDDFASRNQRSRANFAASAHIQLLLDEPLEFKPADAYRRIHLMKYQEKLKKKIDISNDRNKAPMQALFCEYVPNQKLKSIKQQRMR